MNTSAKLLQWVPRGLGILVILLLSLFALDSFSAERTFLQNAVALLMHLIPSLVLLTALIIAWKREKTGGILLTILGVAAAIFLFFFNYHKNHSVTTSLLIVLMMAIPLILAGILFIISASRKKKEVSGNN